MNPRASKVGERLHIDMGGPIDTPPIGGYRHFVLLKDEYSNYRFIHFVKTKDALFDALRQTICEIESKGFKVQTLVSDCGIELTRSKELLLSKSITHETSAPFTPQQNGFIERDNRTVVKAARTLLIHKKLPEYLWGEAANVAVYVLNRVMNKNTKTKNPYGLYHGTIPKVSHLKVFGSLAQVKMQEKKRSGYLRKLEPRVMKTILIGYEQVILIISA